MRPRRTFQTPLARRRSALIAALTAAGLIAGAGLAAADQPKLHYDSTQITLQHPTQNGAAVACPSGKVVGGGIYITGSGTAIEVATSGPTDNHHGWTAYGNNESGSDETLTTSVICSKGDFKYPTKHVTIPTGKLRTMEASCPHGTSVVGGGVYITGTNVTVEVSKSAPLDDNDSDSKPDDGWTATGSQGTGTGQTLFTTAICSSSGSYDYISKSKNVPENSQQGKAANCPDGTQVTGGGVTITGHSVQLELATSAPFDDNDANSAPDDGWTGYHNNDSSDGDQTMTTTAICRS